MGSSHDGRMRLTKYVLGSKTPSKTPLDPSLAERTPASTIFRETHTDGEVSYPQLDVHDVAPLRSLPRGWAEMFSPNIP